MAKALKISAADAKRVIPVLELQGYVKPASANDWMTTLSGEEVSGSKPPRYTRERVQQALDELRRRIAESNRDSRAPYRITRAAAFGDFLTERPRVQSAEVGIQLERSTIATTALAGLRHEEAKKEDERPAASRRYDMGTGRGALGRAEDSRKTHSQEWLRHNAKEQKAQRAFLKWLKGRGSLVQVQPFEPWMSERTHLDLL